MKKFNQTQKRQMLDKQTSYKFRWEFLRRTTAYRQDFARFSEKYPDWHGLDPSWLVDECHKRGEDPRVSEKGCFISNLSKDLEEFRRIWGIDPTDPMSKDSPFLYEG